MKIAITGDWQPNPARLFEFRNQLEAFVEEVEKRACEVILHGGDFFERANVCESAASTGAILDAIVKPLWSMLTEGGERFHGIVGNHDKSSDAARDALLPLELLGADIYREPSVFTIATLPGKRDIIVCAMPWQWSPTRPAHVVGQELVDRANEMADRCELRQAGPRPRILFLAHVQCQRALVSAKRAYEGDGRWCVTPEWLEQLKVDRVALGDFHRRQPDLAGPGRGGYVGAIWQRNFAHEGDPQGFEVWDTETNEVEWVELTRARPHRTAFITNPEEAHAALFDPNTEIGRVVYRGVEPDPADLALFADLGVVVEQEVEAVERVARVEDIPEGILNQPIELIRLWARAQQPPIPDEEVEALVALFTDITADADLSDSADATSPTLQEVAP